MELKELKLFSAWLTRRSQSSRRLLRLRRSSLNQSKRLLKAKAKLKLKIRRKRLQRSLKVLLQKKPNKSQLKREVLQERKMTARDVVVAVDVAAEAEEEEMVIAEAEVDAEIMILMMISRPLDNSRDAVDAEDVVEEVVVAEILTTDVVDVVEAVAEEKDHRLLSQLWTYHKQAQEKPCELIPI